MTVSTAYVPPATTRLVWWYIPDVSDSPDSPPQMHHDAIDAYIVTSFSDDEGIRYLEVGVLSRGRAFLYSRFGTGPGEPVWFHDAAEARRSLNQYTRSQRREGNPGGVR